jgi:Ohr subfamily peroxiredoxin
VAKVLYTAQAHVVGGREHGHATSPDGQIDLQLHPPQELGGDGQGTNPEQLFAAGFAACFEGALAAVARRQRAEIGEAEIDSRVQFIANDDRSFGLAVEMDVSLPALEDAAQAAEIVRAAHRVCPYSNATRGNIEVRLTANGEEVATGGE